MCAYVFQIEYDRFCGLQCQRWEDTLPCLISALLCLLCLAVQGPLDHTRERFWQCVYEQNCSAIVMVTNCVERSLRK